MFVLRDVGRVEIPGVQDVLTSLYRAQNHHSRLCGLDPERVVGHMEAMEPAILVQLIVGTAFTVD